MASTDIIKVRMKVGEHEFEAEGHGDAVVAQLERWQGLAGLDHAEAALECRSWILKEQAGRLRELRAFAS